MRARQLIDHYVPPRRRTKVTQWLRPGKPPVDVEFRYNRLYKGDKGFVPDSLNVEVELMDVRDLSGRSLMKELSDRELQQAWDRAIDEFRLV